MDSVHIKMFNIVLYLSKLLTFISAKKFEIITVKDQFIFEWYLVNQTYAYTYTVNQNN